MTTYYSVPTDEYITLQNYVIGEFRENYPGGLIPVENIEGEPYHHRIPYFEDYDVSKGGLDWTDEQVKANTKLQYLDVPIFLRQMKLAWSPRDVRRMGQGMISAKQQAIMNKFLDEVDYALWWGNIENGVTLSTGILAQATDASHLNIAAGDSVLDSAAELLHGLKTMVQKLDPKYRKLPLVLLMNWGFYDKIALELVGTDTATTVLQVFKSAYPNVNIIVNSKAVMKTGDTEAANGRMCIFAQDVNVLRNVKAKEVGPVGPALVDLTGGVEQLWGTMFAAKVLFATGIYYTGTTAITYA